LKGRLYGAALALLLLVSVGNAAAKPAVKEGPGVTTLAPANDEGWRSSDEVDNSFTSVGVIGGPSPSADPDRDGPAVIDVPPASAPLAADPPRTPAKGGWLGNPVTWGLLLLGVAMIGFALRGLAAARHRLARLEKLDG